MVHDAEAFKAGGIGRSKPQKAKRRKDTRHDKFQSYVAQDGLDWNTRSSSDAAWMDAIMQSAGS